MPLCSNDKHIQRYTKLHTTYGVKVTIRFKMPVSVKVWFDDIHDKSTNKGNKSVKEMTALAVWEGPIVPQYVC